ncbi:DUF4124 domain-containing protein [Pseudaeromonas pectinilytica]
MLDHAQFHASMLIGQLSSIEIYFRVLTLTKDKEITMRHRHLTAGAILCVLASCTLQAAVYKCTDKNGQLTYSGQPCGGDAKPVDVKVYIPSAETVAAAQKDLDELSKQQDASRREREIASLENQIKGKQREMRTELDRLERKKSYANNNLAGATFLNSVSVEMQAVTAQYQAEIDSLRKEIESIQQQ